MGDKLISACIITKNEGEFLKQSIDSYIDYVDELIVIDDFSTDNTVDIVRSYPKANLIQLKCDGNKYRQRNEYLKYAKGKWIFCPDGDEIYLKKDMEWLRNFASQKNDYWCVRFKFLQFWKDFLNVITGCIWDTYLQRFYKRLEGLNYNVHHHSVSFSDGKLLASKALGNNRNLDSTVNVYHLSYIKSSNSIRKKIEYYMRRDNPFCNTEEKVKEYTNKHPYFSGNFSHPRFGESGLYCCGVVDDWKDEVIKFSGDFPESIKSHPKFKLYHDYAKSMNEYMEKHWKFNNHLTYPHHQKRLKETALLCEGDTVEVGCANGDSTGYLQTFNRQAHFYGVEPTDWGYNEAVRNHREIKFFKDYAENLSLADKSFDTVLLSEMIEHVLDTKLVLDEAFRVAKKKVIITTPAKPHPDPDHKRVITPDNVRELLKPYSKNVKISGLTFEGWHAEPKIAQDEKDIHFMIVEALC